MAVNGRYGPSVLFKNVVAKTGDYVVLAADVGVLFTTEGAGGDVEFTLPTLAVGLWFGFYNQADVEMLITATDEKLVAFNDLTADGCSYTTASEHIGGAFILQADAGGDIWLGFALPWSQGSAAQTNTVVSA